MARPRKPTAILRLHGSFKAHPKRAAARSREPEPPVGLGVPPKYFDPADRVCWRELEQTSEPGVCTRMDRPSAELAARLWAKFRRGECNGRELALLAQLFGRFGANPSDRSKVQVPKKAAEPESGFGRLVGTKRPA